MKPPVPDAPSANRPFFRRKELLLALLVLAVAGGAALFFALRPAGPQAVVTAGVAGGQTTHTISLARDADITIEEGLFPVHLQVRGGAIRFATSACPDHVCEGFGWLRREGEWALCAPAQVLVRISNDAA